MRISKYQHCSKFLFEKIAFDPTCLELILRKPIQLSLNHLEEVEIDFVFLLKIQRKDKLESVLTSSDISKESQTGDNFPATRRRGHLWWPCSGCGERSRTISRTKYLYNFLRCQKNFPKGFTLVEILLVALILSIIAGLAVTNFSRTYKRLQLKNTADNLAYVMRYAQGRAAMKNRLLRIEFNPDFSQYWLAEKVVDGENGHFEKISGRLGKVFNVPEAFNMEADSSLIQFYPDGRIDQRYVYVCDTKKCFTVSTKEQRGHVWIFDEKLQ